jgi:EAL domain-containing protein (putative c-di-GMP-specific phosphodiesterase class I)
MESDLQVHSEPPVKSAMESDLGDAIAAHRIIVHFQPQFESRSGRGCGVEALARWPRFDGRQTPPGTFIPVAERTGLIGAMGVSVLYQACSTLAAWSRLGTDWPTLSVNVSARQIDEDFGIAIEQVIDLTGFPVERLELEITESVLGADSNRSIRCMNHWKRLGVRIALDDFGTGYSSLSYLSRLPVDRLKVDKSFVHRMTFDRKTAAIVRAVCALGEDIGVDVLAEGIETEWQFEMLEGFGCRHMQGNLLAKSLPAAAARALLAKPWGARGLDAA